MGRRSWVPCRSFCRLRRQPRGTLQETYVVVGGRLDVAFFIAVHIDDYDLQVFFDYSFF